MEPSSSCYFYFRKEKVGLQSKREYTCLVNRSRCLFSMYNNEHFAVFPPSLKTKKKGIKKGSGPAFTFLL